MMLFIHEHAVSADISFGYNGKSRGTFLCREVFWPFMDPLALIAKYYAPGTKARELLMRHSSMVAAKALRIAERVRHLGPDMEFIREAALLHDIGIFFTNQPAIGCYGDKPYVCHGYLGRALLEDEGFPRHALVCERHVGMGITRDEILAKGLPLPVRDMVPRTLEEQIICYADKFFSKDAEHLLNEKPIETIRKGIARYGQEKLRQLDAWIARFGT